MSTRRRVRHSWLLTWYFGLPFSWHDLGEWRRARRAGARTARMIRDMNDAPTVEMPRVVDPTPPPSSRHALPEPARLLPVAGEGA